MPWLLQRGALLLLPLLHVACPPVHTGTREALLTLGWFAASAATSTLPRGGGDYDGSELIPASAVTSLALAAGTLSARSVLSRRVPVCQY